MPTTCVGRANTITARVVINIFLNLFNILLLLNVQNLLNLHYDNKTISPRDTFGL